MYFYQLYIAELHKALIDAENLVYGIAFVLLVTGGLVLYFTACCIDPGFVPIRVKVMLDYHMIKRYINEEMSYSLEVGAVLDRNKDLRVFFKKILFEMKTLSLPKSV